MAELKTRAGDPFNREPFDSLLRRRMFFTESFEIYRTAPNFKGDNRGLYDYGPPGCALQANVVDLWRKHFVLEENMLELDTTMLTHEDVFKTSGHVDKFADWMCKDAKKGDYLRADHLVENVLEGRLKGDKEARGVKVVEEDKDRESPADAKKKKSKVKDVKALRLEDAVVKEYEEILAKVCTFLPPLTWHRQQPHADRQLRRRRARRPHKNPQHPQSRRGHRSPAPNTLQPHVQNHHR